MISARYPSVRTVLLSEIVSGMGKLAFENAGNGGEVVRVTWEVLLPEADWLSRKSVTYDGVVGRGLRNIISWTKPNATLRGRIWRKKERVVAIDLGVDPRLPLPAAELLERIAIESRAAPASIRGDMHDTFLALARLTSSEDAPLQ